LSINISTTLLAWPISSSIDVGVEFSHFKILGAIKEAKLFEVILFELEN